MTMTLPLPLPYPYPYPYPYPTRTPTPSPTRMKAALSSFMLATDLSEYLVRKGVPFRETHHISGRAVQLAEERGCALTDLSLADLKGLHELFTDDVMKVWDYEASTERKDSTGGTSKRSVLEQCDKLQAWLKEAGYAGDAPGSASKKRKSR